MSLVVCLSGPERTRAQAVVALEDARIPELPKNHHAQMDWPRKLTAYACGDGPPAGVSAEPQGFIAVHVAGAEGLNAAVRVVEPAGWVLRTHHEEPPAPKLDPLVGLAATMAEMQAEIAALKAKVG